MKKKMAKKMGLSKKHGPMHIRSIPHDGMAHESHGKAPMEHGGSAGGFAPGENYSGSGGGGGGAPAECDNEECD